MSVFLGPYHKLEIETWNPRKCKTAFLVLLLASVRDCSGILLPWPVRGAAAEIQRPWKLVFSALRPPPAKQKIQRKARPRPARRGRGYAQKN